MIKFFKIKVEARALFPLKADNFVSEAFEQSAVIELIMELVGGAFVPDAKTMTYLVEDGCLYVQGFALEAQEYPSADWVV
jgi:hypothetical protein